MFPDPDRRGPSHQHRDTPNPPPAPKGPNTDKPPDRLHRQDRGRHCWNLSETMNSLYTLERQALTRPFRPQTNGKIERFHRILLKEWACIRDWHNDRERTTHYDHFVHFYNHHPSTRRTRMVNTDVHAQGQPPRHAHLGTNTTAVGPSIGPFRSRPDHFGLPRRCASGPRL